MLTKYPANYRGIVDALNACVVAAGGATKEYPANYGGITQALNALNVAAGRTTKSYPANYFGINEAIKELITAAGGTPLERPQNYRGIVDGLSAAIGSAGGTSTQYPANYAGIVKTIEDLLAVITASGGLGLHADTRSYRDRILANGGTISDDPLATNAVSNTDLRAVDTFVRSAYLNNYRQYYIEYYPLAGTGLLTAQVKLWYAGTADRLTLVNYVAGDYSRATGLTGSGTSKYVNTNLNPAAQGMNANNVHLSCYSRTDLNSATSVEIGARGATAASESLILAVKLSSNTLFDSYNTSSARVTAGITAIPSLRLFLGNRIGTTDSRTHIDGAQTGAITTSGGTCPSANIFLHAFNNNGTPVNFSARSLGDASVGLGFPTNLISVVNSDRHALMTAFGRAV